MNTKLRSFVSAWMPVIAWMLLIFAASTDLGSAEHTSRFLIPFLYWLDPQISLATVIKLQLWIRKAAHLTEYAVLAILLLRAFSSGWRIAFARQAAVVLVIASLYAATDEFHQTFVTSRTSSARDVAIDCLGAIVGLALYASMRRSARSAPSSAA